jgi:uncharacterized protein
MALAHLPVPLLTLEVANAIETARQGVVPQIACSLDLNRSQTTVEIGLDDWHWQDASFPYGGKIRDRTVYYWKGTEFEPLSRFSGSLIKLVPTEWGPPTFEIDGIKMLPTAKVSPFEDARLKVELIKPRGKVVLDTCGGLGYFAHWCLQLGAAQVQSFEKNSDVLWLRSLNPWSPAADDRLQLTEGQAETLLPMLPPASVDAILHDPPRFGIAGELYSQTFYEELRRVLKPGGLLFHYTGTPNKLTTGRDVPGEILARLERAGFSGQRIGDGLLAQRAVRTKKR